MACVDLSAPKGPSSISELQLPATFVVRGDTMRDSTGKVAPPVVIAFDQNGKTIGDAQATLFLTDSIPRAHFASGVIVGDSLGIAHVVGQIGNLQTAVYPLPVTVAPTCIVRAPTSVGSDTVIAPVGTDSASSIGSAVISVIVRGGNCTPTDTTVNGVRVSYRITKTLESRVASPAVFLIDQTSSVSGLDTTKSVGTSSRTLDVVSIFLKNQSILTGQVDSVVVEASATYRGLPLRGSPVHVVIPVKTKFAQ
jgi:hypothetical protein